MPSPFPEFTKALMGRLRRRKDSEHVQAVIRVVITGLVALYLNSSIGPREPLNIWGDRIATFYFAISPLFVLWIYLRPKSSPFRRYLAMGMEHSLLTLCLGLEGERAAPLFPIYVWVSLGNGFRYGVRPLLVSTLVSTLGFGCVIVFSPFWQGVMPISVGLVLMMVAIPCYAATLVKQLRRAKQAAEMANQAKSRFLATASHELRTPLHAIIGLSELLQRTQLGSEQVEMVQTVRSSGRALLNLVEDVLDLSSIQAGRAGSDLAEFDLYQKIAETMAIARPQAARKKLNLRIYIDPGVPSRLYGDWKHLRQILLNLMTNAIKFTETGHVELAIHALAVSASEANLAFAVRDTGIGIAENDLTQVFESFVQVNDTSTRKHGGVGLGLAIVKQLTELLHGEITATSKPGEGSCFMLQLPFERTAGEAPVIQGGTVVLYSSDPTLELKLKGVYADVVLASDPRFAVSQQTGTSIGFLDTRAFADPDAIEAIAREQLKSVSSAFIRLGERFDDAGGCCTSLSLPLSDDHLASALRIAFAMATHREVEEGLRTIQPDAAPMPLAPVVDIQPASRILPMTGRRVLMVEDSPVNRMVTRKILGSVGYETIGADTADAALERLAEEEFDIILLDLNMPGTSGIDIIKLYRLMRLGETMAPIVVFSADVTEETRRECMSLGVSLFLPKPSEPDYMLARLAEVIPAGTAATDTEVAELAPAVMDEPVRNTAEIASIAEHPRFAAAPEHGVIDRMALDNLAALDANPAFLNELIEAFEEDTRQLLSAIDLTVQNRDLVAFWDCIHAMRSSAANVGAKQLFTTCIEISSQGRASFQMRGSEYAARLRYEFTRFQRAIHRLFAAQDRAGRA